MLQVSMFYFTWGAAKGASLDEARRGRQCCVTCSAARTDLRKEGTPTRICKREGPLCTCERRGAVSEKKKKRKRRTRKGKRRRAWGASQSETRVTSQAQAGKGGCPSPRARHEATSRHVPGPGGEGRVSQGEGREEVLSRRRRLGARDTGGDATRGKGTSRRDM
jgi:hypothetical protein